MESKTDEREKRSAGVFVAFALLAVLAGPVRGYTASTFGAAIGFQTLAGGVLSGTLVGSALIALGVARRQGMLRSPQWLALVMLLVPQWLMLPLTAPYVRAVPWLHETRWAVGFMLSLAAPLWLALLAAMDLVAVEVPRMVAGAAIAGIGAVYLVVPVNAYSLAGNQAPVLVLEVLLNILVVFSWTYAAPRLAGAGTLATAGSFLLLSAAGDIVFSLMFERSSWQPVDWHGMTIPLLLEAVAVACSCWLWFWLLQRMTLAAFGMRTLAAWTATVAPGFVLMGFSEWRIDAAFVIALVAIVFSLRARVAEEQPVALGLSRG
jgi:hypothetical protein